MRAFIDTNIFVYATYPEFPQYEKALAFLKSCLKGHDSWYVSWGVIYEYLRVVTHPGLFTGERLSLLAAIENVRKFVSSPQVEILTETPEHLDRLEDLAKESQQLAGNILHDAHSVVMMREHEVTTIISTDTDFHRFNQIKVMNPLK